jgi:hypothetical protein
MDLAELGPPYHDTAVKIDILLDVPPSSACRGSIREFITLKVWACVSPKDREAIRTTTQRSSPEELVPQHENRLVARKNCWFF